MVHSNSSWSVLFFVIIYSMLTGEVFLHRNYPSDPTVPKPCVRLQNTIVYQGAICQWNETDQRYTPESVQNCEERLKAECPECNKVGCEMYGDRHCCRLRYKARGYNWLDIFYANQYGPSDYDEPVFDIIEIHREIRKHEDFGNRDQPDWPNNSIDASGERGLRWTDLIPHQKGQDLPETIVCVDPANDKCTTGGQGSIFDYLLTEYPDGPEGINKIERSPRENELQAETKHYLSSSCIFILLQKTRYPACRFLYTRYAYKMTVHDNQSNYLPISKFITSEVQVYNLFKNSSQLYLRYAYWGRDDINFREQIFADKTGPK